MKITALVILGLIALIVLVAALGGAFHDDMWYKELKSWQAGIAAVIAFAGLIAAAIVGLGGVRDQIDANAKAAKKQHKREQTTEKLRSAAALAGEVAAVVRTLQTIRQVFVKLLNATDDPMDRRSLFEAMLENDHREMPPMRIYEGLEDRIGILGHTIVEKAAGFHTDLESARRNYWTGHAAEVVSETENINEQQIANYLLTTKTLKMQGHWLLYELKSFIAETTGEQPPEPPAADEDETAPPARSA